MWLVVVTVKVRAIVLRVDPLSSKVTESSLCVRGLVGEGRSTYAMFPELFDHSQAEDLGYLCVHRKTGGQNVSILTHNIQRQRVKIKVPPLSTDTE